MIKRLILAVTAVFTGLSLTHGAQITQDYSGYHPAWMAYRKPSIREWVIKDHVVYTSLNTLTSTVAGKLVVEKSGKIRIKLEPHIFKRPVTKTIRTKNRLKMRKNQ